MGACENHGENRSQLFKAFFRRRKNPRKSILKLIYSIIQLNITYYCIAGTSNSILNKKNFWWIMWHRMTTIPSCVWGMKKKFQRMFLLAFVMWTLILHTLFTALSTMWMYLKLAVSFAIYLWTFRMHMHNTVQGVLK